MIVFALDRIIGKTHAVTCEARLGAVPNIVPTTRISGLVRIALYSLEKAS
jgi:hypothetical protein